MSDSSIALKPVIDEPSKPMPSSSAPSISDGVIAKLFRCPSMSVNQKRTYSTPSFSICLRRPCAPPGSDVARSLLSIIATFGCSSRKMKRPQEPRAGAEASSPQNRAEPISPSSSGPPRCTHSNLRT